MRAHQTVRLNLHLDADGRPLSWALVRYTTDPRGVVRASLEDHGCIDMSDPDPSGIAAVAQVLLRAVTRMA